MEPAPLREGEARDLGFGTVVAQESRQRLLNRDGSFNVSRRGLKAAASLSLYHTLALVGPAGGEPAALRAFFFSVETFSTIGYGIVGPAGLAANLVVTVEALIGLLWLALATGLLFARFSRPTARVLFSARAVVAPYRGGTAFEFRIANARGSQLIEVEAKVLFTRFVSRGACTPGRRTSGTRSRGGRGSATSCTIRRGASRSRSTWGGSTASSRSRRLRR